MSTACSTCCFFVRTCLFWLLLSAPFFLLVALFLILDGFESRLIQLADQVTARGQELDLLKESVTSLKAASSRTHDPVSRNRDPFRYKDLYKELYGLRYPYEDSYADRDSYGFNDPYDTRYDSYRDLLKESNCHILGTCKSHEDRGSRYKNSYKVRQADYSSTPRKVDGFSFPSGSSGSQFSTSGGCNPETLSACNEKEKKYVEKMKSKDHTAQLAEITRLQGMEGKAMGADSKEWLQIRIKILQRLAKKEDAISQPLMSEAQEYNEDESNLDRPTSAIRCDPRTKKHCSDKEIEYISRQAGKSQIELTAEINRLWAVNEVAATTEEREWDMQRISILEELVAESDYYSTQAADGDEYYPRNFPSDGDYNLNEGDYKLPRSEAADARCDIKTHNGCSDKEKKYVEKQRSKSPENVEAELKRLQGMKEKEMATEQKDWLNQRCQILEDVMSENQLSEIK